MGAAALAVGTAFLWWHGFRTFTTAGAALVITGVIQVGMHRRELVAEHPRRTGAWRALARATPLVLALFPSLVALRSAGVAHSFFQTADGDLWIGSLLYLLGILELVEVAALRVLHDP